MCFDTRRTAVFIRVERANNTSGKFLVATEIVHIKLGKLRTAILLTAFGGHAITLPRVKLLLFLG